MSVYIFLGPTLPLRDARRHLEATYLPPVAQGDVLRLLDRRPKIVGIVDGYFEMVPSVVHKEILLALESGVHVLGASSMGALRAAELDVFGMKGVGQIYRWYASGRLEDDDEVAVVHGPADQGYREMSDAMVNVRDRCASAVRHGVLSKRVAQRFVEIAKAQFYPDRRWPHILAESRAAGVPERDVRKLADYLKREKAPSLKARDAIALLQRVKAMTTRELKPWRARTRTERTKYIGRLLAEAALPAEAGDEGARGADRAGEIALQRLLIARDALHSGHQITDEDVQTVEDALRRELGLLSGASVTGWLERAGLSPEDFDAWMRDEALAAKVRVRLGNAITLQAHTEGRRLRARALAESSKSDDPR